MIVDPIPRIKITKGGHKVKIILVKCDTCGAENVRSWILYRNSKAYRCTKCANKCKKNVHRIGVSPANVVIRCVVECLRCGKQKLKSRSLLKKAPLTFCNIKCQVQWQHANTQFNKGKLNPAYKHGERLNGSPSGYGSDFSIKLRRLVKIRDGYNCQRCRTNFSGTRGRLLDVHHVDEDKFNNELSNLVSLCKPCHTRTHWDR